MIAKDHKGCKRAVELSARTRGWVRGGGGISPRGSVSTPAGIFPPRFFSFFFNPRLLPLPVHASSLSLRARLLLPRWFRLCESIPPGAGAVGRAGEREKASRAGNFNLERQINAFICARVLIHRCY